MIMPTRRIANNPKCYGDHIKHVPLTALVQLSHNHMDVRHGIVVNRKISEPIEVLHPCTLPTMLYRLLKKVNHSFSTFFSLSPRSSYSGLQSSGFSDD